VLHYIRHGPAEEDSASGLNCQGPAHLLYVTTMRLLLTNDDGVNAPGLRALYQGVRDLGEVTVVAPAFERSAVGHAITLSDPLRVSEQEWPDGIRVCGVSGTTADCVKIAVGAILKERPDIVLSGINDGANVGTNILYSGTVSAATEAVMLGIPAAALSLASRHSGNFRPAAAFGRELALRIAQEGLPPGVSLNANIPPLPEEEIRGVAVTRQGHLRVTEWFDRRIDPRQSTYYWMAGESTLDESPEGSDFDDAALRAGFISVTPINFDLTAEEHLDRIRNWSMKKNSYES
jgi:5'-nucleotidase